MATPFLTVFAMKYDLDTNIYRVNVNGTTGFHQLIFSVTLNLEWIRVKVDGQKEKRS